MALAFSVMTPWDRSAIPFWWWWYGAVGINLQPLLVSKSSRSFPPNSMPLSLWISEMKELY